MSSANGPHHHGKIREIDVPLFAVLATASGKNTESARQLAKLACPLLTRLVLKHNNIAEVRREGGREQGWSRKGEHKRARYVLVLMLHVNHIMGLHISRCLPACVR